MKKASVITAVIGALTTVNAAAMVDRQPSPKEIGNLLSSNPELVRTITKLYDQGLIVSDANSGKLTLVSNFEDYLDDFDGFDGFDDDTETLAPLCIDF